MKKRMISVVFIALFLVLSLLPSLGILLVGESDALANEIRAPRAEIHTVSGAVNRFFLNDFGAYFADRIAFRKQLITAWAAMDSAVFHTSAEDQVLLGSDGWLYFSPTLDDYMGRSLSDEELESIAKNLAEMQTFCEEKGARFVFAIAPNKNSLYPGQMPSWIPADHGDSNAVKLQPYLERYGVNSCDLFTLFGDRGEILYYRTDSHWTNRGAALAADALLGLLGIESDFYAGPFAEGENHLGDLYNMLYPAGGETEEGFRYVPGFGFTAARNPNGGETKNFTTSCEARQGRLLCWRDSFGNSLYPYLAESFAEAQFINAGKYDLSLVEKQGADLVIFELVERNLKTISGSEPPIIYPNDNS